MALVLYRQSKAFLFLSRPSLVRLSVSTGLCIAAYNTGKYLQTTEDVKSKTYGRVLKRYGLVCGCIHWGHVIVTCAGALVFAKLKNFPRALYLQRGFYYGEKLGFPAMMVYLLTREMSGREWFAQIAASSYTGLNYGILQSLKGWAAYHALLRGLYAGIAIYLSYSVLCWCNDLYQIFRDPDLLYSEWHNFDIEHYTYHRVVNFFNLDEWVQYYENRDVRETIVKCREEMDELEQLVLKLNLDKDDLVHVQWSKINDRMFEIIEEVQTGRHQFDNDKTTTSSLMDTFIRSFDPAYTYGDELKEKNRGRKY